MRSPAVMIMAVPAAVAILPASSLVRMPPRDSSDAGPPAIASISGVMRSTSGTKRAARSLAGAWAEELARCGLKSGQVLVTLGDTEERRRYLNVRATVSTLLKMKAVPVINENDTVATAEIKFGDNDRLGARVA